MNSKGIDCLGDNGVCIPISTHSVKTVKKQTNAQKIRSMTDEELAEFINGIERYDDYAILINGDTVIDMTSCILDWLQSEAE